MPQARHRVQILTYNGHLGQGMDLKNPDLSEWLIPTLQRGREEEKRSGEKGESPDFVAIGFQEMIPLVRFLTRSLGRREGECRGRELIKLRWCRIRVCWD